MEKKIKIIIGSEFTGFDSGWPTRYIGFIRQLYKWHNLSIFAPGDTSLFRKMFPNASVCQETRMPKRRKKHAPITFRGHLKELVRPSRYALLNADPTYTPQLHQLILRDPYEYDISIYFGRSSFIHYGAEDNTPRIFCDFCDSLLRHKYNELRMKKIEGVRNYLSLHYDIMYAKRIKRRFFSTNIAILAITKEDCKYLSSVLRRNRVIVVPNGMNIPNFAVNREFIERKYRSSYLLFLGSLDYTPNIESIFFTLDNLWPVIHERFPDMIFRIVGRSPTPELIQKTANIKGVDLIGPVESVTKYCLESKCFLGPIFTGGGMKNKFLESLSTGTPVITTPEGAIGIDMKTGCHGKIGTAKEELLEGTIELLSCSKDEYSRYVINSISLAKRYSWENVGALLNSILLDTKE